MRFCFAAIPAYGHVFPMVPLAAAAQAAGHDVRFSCGERFAGRLPVPVISGVPAGLTLHDAEQEAFAVAGDRGDPFWFPRAMFGTVMPRHTVPRIRAEWAEHGRPDLLVHEVSNLGPARVAAEEGVPAAAFNIGMQPGGWLELLRPEIDAWPTALIDPSPPSWSEWTESTGTDRLPIRSVAWSDADGAGADWLAAAASGPRAYLTLGTVSFGAVEVLRRSILAAARVCERVLVAAGPEGDPAALGDLPASVRVERFVDQGAVLRHADIAVHHGGTGSLLACLAAGVRQVLTPQGADQFINAARLSELGLGTVVPNDAPVDALDTALADLLSDRELLARTEAMRAEIAAMPSPDDVVAQLVERARG